MSIVSALFKNFGEDDVDEDDVIYVLEGEMIIEKWGMLDDSFQVISDLTDFTEQSEEDFKTKFGVTDLVNQTAITTSEETFHYGYEGNREMPAIFIQLGS